MLDMIRNNKIAFPILKIFFKKIILKNIFKIFLKIENILYQHLLFIKIFF